MSSISFDFRGAHVIVTGGTSGIGAATARAFAQAGAQVTITGTRASLADYDLADYVSHAVAIRYEPLQLADATSIDEFARRVDRIDVLVNNAGHIMPEASFLDCLKVNLDAVYRLTSALHPKLADSRLESGASVVNLASMMSFFGSPWLPGYGAAKAGVVQLTKTLAAGWAKDGIRVNAVAAGSVPTRMTSKYAEDPEIAAMVNAKTPMGRWARPEEIAAPILYLSSPAASFVTGHTLVADGGYSIID